VPAVAGDPVAARSAEQPVGTRAAQEPIVSRAPVKDVAPATADDAVCMGSADVDSYQLDRWLDRARSIESRL
jgi:hypothetical protein